LVVDAIAVAYDEESQTGAETKQNETVFAVGVVGVGQDQRLIIIEDRLGLLEGDPVLSHVPTILVLIPLDTQSGHDRTIPTK
jgi:hypothetical protein